MSNIYEVNKRNRITKKIVVGSGLLFEDEIRLIVDNGEQNADELLELAKTRMNNFVSGKFPLTDNGNNTFSFLDSSIQLSLTFKFMTNFFGFASNSLKKSNPEHVQSGGEFCSNAFTMALINGFSNAIDFLNSAFYVGKKNPLEEYQISYTPENRAIAIFTEHYQPQQHLPIVQAVIDNGLHTNLSYIQVNSDGLFLGLYQGNNSDNQVKIYFEIENGVSGKNALSVRPVMRTNSKSKVGINIPFKADNRKHMSNVGLALDSIFDNLALLADFNYETILNEMSNYQAYAILDSVVNKLTDSGMDGIKLQEYYSMIKARNQESVIASEIVFDMLNLIGGDKGDKKHGAAKWLTPMVQGFVDVVFALPN